MSRIQGGSPNQARGYAIAVAAAAFLSTTAIFIRHLSLAYGVPPLVLALWRDIFTVATLLAAFAIVKPSLLRVEGRHLPYLAAYGLVLAFFNCLWTLSVALNGASVATVLVYSSGAFAAILGRIFLKEALGWAKLVAIALIIGGCAFVAGILELGSWRGNAAGIAVGVAAGLSYGCYSVFGRSAADRGLNPWTTLIYTFAFATLYIFLVNCVPGGPVPGSAKTFGEILWLGSRWLGWLVLFLLAAIPTVGGFGLYNVSLSILPSSVASLVVSLEPVFTAITAFVLLGERLTAAQFAGAALILGGVVVLQLFEGRRRRPRAA